MNILILSVRGSTFDVIIWRLWTSDYDVKSLFPSRKDKFIINRITLTYIMKMPISEYRTLVDINHSFSIFPSSDCAWIRISFDHVLCDNDDHQVTLASGSSEVVTLVTWWPWIAPWIAEKASALNAKKNTALVFDAKNIVCPFHIKDATRFWLNAGFMLDQRRRRWANMKPTLIQRPSKQSALLSVNLITDLRSRLVCACH